MEESITCKVFELSAEGLVSLKEIPGGHLVAITEQGQAVLAKASAVTDAAPV